ncbi:long-chain fatty acid--CoA ligase [Pseudomonas sp. 5P_3.1_Bac2]|uniref:long-chain fatty acid--CoA ligase n=1 Tax=Pseudomonas sp. 5P_3.1_Bac2 TaxID=2971617 RepID=UPI0021CAB8CF|nr:long-chain fatty acid--CoA ligase [Pseudomonas sp. 5P_3.1_Bac2]MCU1717065.1 long-chain fatty acid--CoA ligase [Pseudomonas sp. 5P_3.1_Bac2]
MLNLMMDDQLNISMVMEYAEQTAAHVEIVSVLSNGQQHRYTYADAFQRARKLANALDQLQIAAQEPVATLAWNDYRHFELYYAVPCSGRICHTINPRLFPEQIVYIIKHAKNRIVFLDPQFVPLLEKIHSELPLLQHIVVLCAADELPQSSLPNLISYEALIATHPDSYMWPELDERTPSGLCYTSGTTGNPKGVLYSHRSTLLHTLAGCLPNATNLSGADVVLPIVPMFHVNAWGVPYSAAITGCKLVLPGNKAGDGATLTALINQEQVTYAMGVPTVWLALVNHLESSGQQVSSLRRAVSGGAACPLALIERMRAQGIDLEVGWGMTETSPLGSYNRRQPWYDELPSEQYQRQVTLAGRQVFGIRLRIVSPDGQSLPRDGKASGILQARGPWVACGYYGGTPSKGWFDTGDVATINPQGYVCIVDRTKDVIKSGGEWISSIDIENAVMAHPAVLEAAVIGLPHPTWSERPLLVVVPRPTHSVEPSELLEFLKDRVAKWWLPDLCILAEGLPHTATGKVSKKDLREQYQEIQWPQSATQSANAS